MASGNSQWFSAPASQTIYGHVAQRDEAIRRQIIDQFIAADYQLISLPALIPAQNSTAEWTGDDTAAMVLRTDTTVQVAHAVAKAKNSSLDNLPEQLSYAEKVITKFPKHPLVSREYTQMGVENFSMDSNTALLSVMTLLKNMLQDNAEVLFEVSIVQPIKSLIHQIPDLQLRDLLLKSISMKAQHQVNELSQSLTTQQQEIVKLLLTSYCDLHDDLSLDHIETILARLQQLSMISPAQVKTDLQSLNTLANLMSGSLQPVNFDLSIPSVDSYYSGLIVNVYHPSLPFALVSGGQYNILGLNGVGFTVRTDLLREINFANAI